MVYIIVIVTVIVFITVDLLLRLIMHKMKASKIRKKRKEALDIGLCMKFADETTSLKRVTVENPKAKILAVDDEEIVLDSFRKILVLAGYSVDTVETGPEALTMAKNNDYDFVFTDLKMPEMDGIEVTKAVKHLQPEVDVIMITGYGTIESAVDVMKHGAMDYVQKPFTENELVEMVEKFVIRRHDRIERQTRPVVHLVTPSIPESSSRHEFNVPAGAFISPEHTWVNIEMNGVVRVGIDDFVQKIIGPIDDVELPKLMKKIKKGEPLFSIRRGSRKITIPSPVTGTIASTNTDLMDRISLIKRKPYEHGWICRIEASDLTEELKSLKISSQALAWYQKEVDKYMEMVKELESKKTEGSAEEKTEDLEDKNWEAFTKTFLHV